LIRVLNITCINTCFLCRQLIRVLMFPFIFLALWFLSYPDSNSIHWKVKQR